uniref:Uncharacterized protein n=1 Tax=Chromera velia CCMP2878 TaxID=1169474 RepID=A0A0G4HGM9_9ALVE|eukprot:Cvel_6742.t1-p1 / transcript=Cvel_6742.t1 / gene=Cvel_6742 / organism=Chromera_velia_CCMP2878 / gene_product=hypothetical protein / transcript_product=hypothetical protein / location=Cvel_scaffold337:65350-66138(-) / protein_length=263 / sequence_SO=supercontig / SO=protein_coding / is_pseudo=false
MSSSRHIISEPWIREASEFPVEECLRGKQPGDHFKIPVLLLRFTHSSIDSRLSFQNQESMYKTFDQLQRGTLLPDDLDEPLDVCYEDGILWSISNRRLFVLLMHQSVHRDKTVYAPCVLRTRTWKSSKFLQAKTTRNRGLGISPKEGGLNVQQPQHRSAPIFDRGTSAFRTLKALLEGSPFEYLLDHVQLRSSAFLIILKKQNLVWKYCWFPEVCNPTNPFHSRKPYDQGLSLLRPPMTCCYSFCLFHSFVPHPFPPSISFLT